MKILLQLHVGYDLHYDVAGNLSVKYSHEYMTDLITERAEDIIFNHNHSKPLYLQLSHIAAHSSKAKKKMEVRDEKETNATLGYIEDFNRRKLAGMRREQLDRRRALTLLIICVYSVASKSIRTLATENFLRLLYKVDFEA